MAFKIEKIGELSNCMYMIEICEGRVEKSVQLEGVPGFCSENGELVALQLTDLKDLLLKQLQQLAKYHKQVQVLGPKGVALNFGEKKDSDKTISCSMKFDLDYQGNILFIEIF